MMSSRELCLSMGVVVAITAMMSAPVAGWENLLPNASFEDDGNGDGIADGWSPNIHSGAEGRFQLDADQCRVGRVAQQIVHSNTSSEWVRLSRLDIPARPEELYRFDGWVRATCAWQILLYEFPRGSDRDKYVAHRIAGGGATEWTAVGRVVQTASTARDFKLSLVTSGQGEAWFDDVCLVNVSQVPEMVVPRLPSAPDVDGRVVESAWDGAVAIDGLLLLGGGGEKATPATTVSMGFRDGTLFVAWQCVEPRMADVRVGDPPGWGHDTVELFLGAPDAGVGYHQFGLTPTGGKLTSQKSGSTSGYYLDWYSTQTTKTTPRQAEWLAAATRSDAGWSGEMAVDVRQFVETLKPGAIWRLQLARSRKVAELEQNSCWSYTPGDTFHVPTRFGRIVLPIVLQAAPETVALRASAAEAPLRLVPMPQRVRRADAPPVPAPTGPLTISAPAAGAARSAAACLKRFLDAGGLGPCRVVSHAEADTADILLGDPGASMILDHAWLVFDGMDSRLEPWQLQEAYALDTCIRPIVVAAKGARGLLYGVQTLRQLLVQEQPYRTGTPMLAPVRIADWPDLQWRGWHLISPERSEAVESAMRMIDVLAGLKMNWVALQIDNRLAYTGDPELGRPGAPTKAELSALVRHAESYLMEVIPMTQCWSHFSYFLSRDKYRHLAEVQEPAPKARWKYWNYCPRHPGTHTMLFGMIEEQLECFPNAKYFHVGLDEITFEPIGVCDRCRNSTGGELLAEEVKRLHSFVTSKGLSLCMWGDQLLVEHNGKPPYSTAEALPSLPRDIVIFDWHYSPWQEFPSVRFFTEAGFPVVASGWYEPLNVTRFSRTALDEGALGYGGTTWYGIDRVRQEIRLMTAIPLSAENCWSSERPGVAEIDTQPADVFRQLWDARPSRQASDFVPVDISQYANRTLEDDELRRGCLGLGPDHDLSAFPHGLQWLGGVPFRIPAPSRHQCIVLGAEADDERQFPSRVWRIPINVKAQRLALLQTCSRPPEFSRHIYDRAHVNPGDIMRLILHYADGQKAELTLRWNIEIADWNSQLGSAFGRTAWVGRTEAGARVRTEVFEWEHPHPECVIEALDVISAKSSVRPVILALTAVR